MLSDRGGLSLVALKFIKESQWWFCFLFLNYEEVCLTVPTTKLCHLIKSYQSRLISPAISSFASHFIFKLSF